MNSKATRIWFAIAAILFAGIFISRHFSRSAATGPAAVLPHFRPDAVTSVQVIPAGAAEIRIDRTNGNWLLSKPITFPAQPVAIDALLEALQKLVAVSKAVPAETHDNKNFDTEFGFGSPQFSVVIEAGAIRRQIIVGNKTAPGDQVFVQITGEAGAYVTDVGWLNLLPHSADQWRDTSLIGAGQNDFDWIVLTNGTRIVELRRNPTNHFWQLMRPLPSRADSERITEALQRLRLTRVAQFVTDDPKADLTTYGLQPTAFDLCLGQGTNFVTALHAGKSPAEDSTQVYVKREGWNTVFTIDKEPLLFWRGALNDFRDPRLLELTAPVAEIEMRGLDTNNDMVLRRQGSNDWVIAGEKFPADAESVQSFVKLLADLRITEFVKDVVTAPDLPAYGLDAPSRQIIFRSVPGDTNTVVAQLDFGTNQDNKVFVRRSDEDFIYALAASDLNRLPEEAWQLRDRRIWNFNAADVTQVTLQQNGRTRQLVHNGLNKWSLAVGSQGVVSGGSVEQAIGELSRLTASGWVARNMTEPEKYGFKPDNLQLVIELKDGKKLALQFGAPISDQSVLAAVTMDGERWVFVFPPRAYLFVLNYLTIPANVP